MAKIHFLIFTDNVESCTSPGMNTTSTISHTPVTLKITDLKNY